MNAEELEQEIKEKQRIEKQYQRNAECFADNYFKHKSWAVRDAVIKTYLKIVRDKIIF